MEKGGGGEGERGAYREEESVLYLYVNVVSSGLNPGSCRRFLHFLALY